MQYEYVITAKFAAPVKLRETTVSAIMDAVNPDTVSLNPADTIEVMGFITPVDAYSPLGATILAHEAAQKVYRIAVSMGREGLIAFGWTCVEVTE